MRRTTNDFHLDPPYDELLKGVLSFAKFADTEESLSKLDELRHRFEALSDKKGVEYCRQLARIGRRRAEMISRNKRVRLRKREQKKEIALWFQIWLETPELFHSWLTLRKQSPEYHRLAESDLD